MKIWELTTIRYNPSDAKSGCDARCNLLGTTFVMSSVWNVENLFDVFLKKYRMLIENYLRLCLRFVSYCRELYH
jgi:hypothetical protein